MWYYTTLILQEDLLTFVDVRTLKIKHEEQFKYEVNMITSQLGIEGPVNYCIVDIAVHESTYDNISLTHPQRN